MAGGDVPTLAPGSGEVCCSFCEAPMLHKRSYVKETVHAMTKVIKSGAAEAQAGGHIQVTDEDHSPGFLGLLSPIPQPSHRKLNEWLC